MKVKVALLSLVVFMFTVVSMPLLAKEKAGAGNKAKLNDIRKLLVITGSGELGMMVMNHMIDSFKVSLPQVPVEFWDEFMKEVNSDELIDLVVPIYDKYLMHKDIKGLIKFFKSRVGKKYISVLPQITVESMAAGEKWGEKLAEKVSKKLEQKGYK